MNAPSRNFSDQFVKHHAEGMMEEVVKVTTSPDLRMANREWKINFQKLFEKICLNEPEESQIEAICQEVLLDWR